MASLQLTPVEMMNAGEILELLPRLAPALSHKLRTFLQRSCERTERDGSATIGLYGQGVAELLVAAREECAAELKGLLRIPAAAVVQDSVQGGVLAHLCFCLLLALAPSLPRPEAQSSLALEIGTHMGDWTWLGSECGEQALEVLCSALMSQHWSTPVRHLEMYSIKAFGTERACQHLAHLLDSTHCKLQSLIMRDTGTRADGTSHIARALLANTTLTRLELSFCNEVGDRGVEHLAAMLRNNSTIQELSLRDIGMTGEGVGHLRDALLSQSQAASNSPPMHVGTAGLKTLDISGNPIGQPGAVHLAAILANNRCSSLRKLKVWWCGLEDEGEGCLAEGLRTNNTLEELDISRTKMGQKALEALVRCLATDNSTLKILEMCDAGEWPAAELIAFMISSNQSLEELNLREASYSATEWATIILPALSGNKTLKSIDLTSCEGLEGKEVEAAFFDLLRINTTIQTVNLSFTPLERAGKAEGIQEEVRRNMDFRNALSTMAQGKPKSCRLILCGNAYAGKSTLFQAMKVIMQSNAQKTTCFPDQPLARLVCGQSSHDRELEKRTRGIEIHSLKDNEDLRVSAWDLAGQREFHALHDVMFPSAESAAALFMLTFNPIVSPGDKRAGKMKRGSELEEELWYWLRLIASNYKPDAVAPSVVVVITNKDRLTKKLAHVDSWFQSAKGSIVKLKVQFDGRVNVGEIPFLVNALARQDPELEKLCSHMEQSLKSTLDRLPMEPVICTRVLKILQREFQTRPVISMSEFAGLCSIWSLPKEANVEVEMKDKDKECKPVAAYLHNSGEVIYHDNLNIIVTQPRWFGHGVLGRLIDIFSSEGQGRGHFFSCFSKPAVRQERPQAVNGFVNKMYLSWLLQEAVKSVPGMDSKAVTSDQLIHLMLLLNLCYEERPSDPNTGYFLPAIFDDVGNKAAEGKQPRTWRKAAKGSIIVSTFFSRRLQCADQRTCLTDGFFPRLQVVFHNHALTEKWDAGGNSDCCTLEKNFIGMWVNGMDILIEFSGSSGSFVDIMVKSSQSHQLTMEFVHQNFIGKIRSFCASHEGCQGVTLEERIIRPGCFPINDPGPMLCVYRKDQSITVEKLKSWMENTPNYMHSWGELKDEAGALLLPRSADSGATLLDRPVPPARAGTTQVLLPAAREQLALPPARHIFVTREDVSRVSRVLAKVQIGKVVPLRLHLQCEWRDGEHEVPNQPGRTFFVVDSKFAIQQGFLRAAVNVGAVALNAGGAVVPGMSVAGGVLGSVAWYQGTPVYDVTIEALSRRIVSQPSDPAWEEELRALVERDLQQSVPGTWMKEFFNRDTNAGCREFNSSFLLTEVVYASTSSTALLCEDHCTAGGDLGLIHLVK